MVQRKTLTFDPYKGYMGGIWLSFWGYILPEEIDMARLVKPLTATQIQNAKPRDAVYKMFDGGGLFLQVTPPGGKHWKMKYRQENGKENLLSFGPYPAVTLEQARRMRDEAKSRKAQGVDPAGARRKEKADRVKQSENTFEAVAKDWLDVHSTKVKPKTVHEIIVALRRHILPLIGGTPVRELKAPDFLDMLRRLEASGQRSAVTKSSIVCGQVMRFAVATGRADFDPLPSLRGSLKTYKKEHFAATTDPKQFGRILRAIHSYSGSFIVGSALKMAPYVFVRPGELQFARWADMDLEACEWRYTAGKTDTPHIVPLAPQVMAILKALHSFTGQGEWVFTNLWLRNKPIGKMSLTAALRFMGIGREETTVHGFRATARTLLDEVLGERYDLIEQQLAHTVRDPNGRAYNRTTHLAERKRMMERWATYCDSLRDTIEEDKAGQNFSTAPAV
jgi:integrase